MSDSVPVARVQLEHAGCLLERGRKAEALALFEEARRAMQAAGPAGTALQLGGPRGAGEARRRAELRGGHGRGRRVRLAGRRPRGRWRNW